MPSAIPRYALYGDQPPAWLAAVHVEQIHERSSAYDYEIAPHLHDGLLQLLYVTQGHGELQVDGQRWPIAAPALVLVPAGHVHGFAFSPDIDGPVVTAAQAPLETLAAAGAPDLLPLLRRPCVLAVAGAPHQAQALPPLFDALARECRQPGPGGVSAGGALLLAVCVQVARVATLAPVAGAPGRSHAAAVVERFRAQVDEHLPQRWPVQRHAQALGLSAGQLSRLCRAVLGLSALGVLNARTVLQAQRELVYSGQGVKQVAALLGFADEAYFGRFFRKHTGHTPTAFRALARGQLTAAAARPAPRSGTRAGTAPTAPRRWRP
jgi:AraC family transcriptional activator of pobA